MQMSVSNVAHHASNNALYQTLKMNKINFYSLSKHLNQLVLQANGLQFQFDEVRFRFPGSYEFPLASKFLQERQCYKIKLEINVGYR